MDAGRTFCVLSYLLQQTLRGLCSESEWVYAIFWRILPRNFPPPKWDEESGILDGSIGNKRNWILVWEDGYCDFFACAKAAEMNAKVTELQGVLQPELFFKMSHEIYSYGEGLMGKVAAEGSHRWVFRDPSTHYSEPQPHSAWKGTIDPHPRTWEAQFKCGIETIAIVAVKEGLIQLGSLLKVAEDLNIVLFLQRKFNYMQAIPGVYATTNALLSPQYGEVAAPLTEKVARRGERHEDSQKMGAKVKQGGTSMSWQACTFIKGFSELDKGFNNNEAITDKAPQHSIVPSMSSLQTLLFKLPCVNPTSTNTTSFLKDPSLYSSDNRAMDSTMNIGGMGLCSQFQCYPFGDSAFTEKVHPQSRFMQSPFQKRAAFSEQKACEDFKYK